MAPNTTPRNMPSKQAIWEHWKDTFQTGDPEVCMACSNDMFPTERAHLLARFDGGGDAVENHVLLCSQCHRHQEFLSSVMVATGRPADMGDLRGFLGMIGNPDAMHLLRQVRNGDMRPVSRAVALPDTL